MRLALALAAALAAAPALAQEEPSQVPPVAREPVTPTRAAGPETAPVPGSCGRDGVCNEFQVLRRDRVAGPPQATLFRIQTRAWTAASRAEGGRVQDAYVLCSPTTPAFITPDPRGDGYSAVYMAPLVPAEYETSLDGYVVYFEACHGRGLDIREGGARLADKLGYTALAERARPVHLSRPEDILAGAWDDVVTGSVAPLAPVTK